MKKLLLIAVCALGVMTASAQRASSTSSSFFSTEKVDGGVQFGIRAGLSLGNISISNEDDSESSSFDNRTSWHVGVIADIPFMESLYLQTGLLLQNKGAKNEYKDGDDTYKETMSPLYLEIPVLASYRYNFSDAAQMQINVGPYFAYGISGKFKEEYEGEEHKEDLFGDEEGAYGLKRFDCGLQFGVGVTLSQHYYLGFAYQLGMTNIAHKSADSKLKNKNLMISLGYTF